MRYSESRIDNRVTLTTRCPDCRVGLLVAATCQSGRDELEAFACPACGALAGNLRCGDVPRVQVTRVAYR